MLVYRDGRREVHAARLLEDLARSLKQAAGAASAADLPLNALLRSGALESTLSDAAATGTAASLSQSAEIVSDLTDALAGAVLGSAGVSQSGSAGACPERSRRVLPATRILKRCDPEHRTQRVQSEGSHLCFELETARRLVDQLASLDLPESVCVSAPEGFAYYGLDPLAYADAVDRVEIGDRPVFVVGLRTIGSTLSAIVAAAARRRDARAERMTVRPSGHPWDRKTEFTPAQRRRIADSTARRALFFIVDEGPGLSGSSLVSVADALAELGVGRPEIVVFCAHAPDLSALRSRRAAERWPELRVVTAGQTLQPPPDAAVDWSGGLWRRALYRDSAHWPAVWPQVERMKFVSRDGARLYKFEGLGPYGDKPIERAHASAAAGWAPAVEAACNGFAACARLDGAPMSHRDLDAEMIEKLARYCDFRQREMRAPTPPVEPLGAMTRVNLWEESGLEYEPESVEICRPVTADARMMPHKWLRDREGRVWKTDSASHGDDHFYPGVTDIAWDLAGAMVEWRMDGRAAGAFLALYRRLSGDDARTRLSFFVTAYAAFRLGFCRMAAEACVDERERLTRKAEHYRSCIESPVRLLLAGACPERSRRVGPSPVAALARSADHE